MRVMITGGGTGGHTSPAVAIIEELHKRDPRLLAQWVGRKGAIEERVSRATGVPFRHVPVEGWPRGRSVRKVWSMMKLGLGVTRAIVYIKRFEPQVVVGVGGYVCIPLCYAAQKLGVPVVLHEQNKRLGMANRLLAPKAARLLLSYPDTLGDYPREKAQVVGNPVRAGFLKPPAQAESRARFNLDPDVPVVLVTGGSQGARSVNAAVADAVTRFEPGSVQFLWMTGKADIEMGKAAAQQAGVRVEPTAFIDDMPAACAAADLMVCRAGASSTAEIAMMGKPSILIPYPLATDNHQEQNARAFADAGASVLLLDKECTGDRLSGLIRECLGDPQRLRVMGRAAAGLARPGAAEAIVEEILMLAFSDENR